jgi:hypothetical protein
MIINLALVSMWLGVLAAALLWVAVLAALVSPGSTADRCGVAGLLALFGFLASLLKLGGAF